MTPTRARILAALAPGPLSSYELLLRAIDPADGREPDPTIAALGELIGEGLVSDFAADFAPPTYTLTEAGRAAADCAAEGL